MNEHNQAILDYLGISEWHRQGYTGKGIKCFTAERYKDQYESEHSTQTAFCFHEVAPDASLEYVRVRLGGNNPTEKRPNDEVFADELVAKGITIGFSSQTTKSTSDYAKEDDALLDHPQIKFVMAAGNESYKSHSEDIKYPSIWGIGATHLENGKIKVAGYSSETPLVDFASIANFEYEGKKLSGTSFATPCICGMIVLVDSFFWVKTGSFLTKEKMYQFILDNIVDIDEEGKDDKTGWGIFILPNPQDIEIERYAEMKTIEELVEKFEDKDLIAQYAMDEEAFRVALDEGLMQGKGNIFDPLGKVTRQDLAIVAGRIYSAVKKAVLDDV